ncbi:MAG TPA: SGNH/GDSL hydrolase family protein [Humisphaera sp.]
MTARRVQAGVVVQAMESRVLLSTSAAPAAYPVAGPAAPGSAVTFQLQGAGTRTAGGAISFGTATPTTRVAAGSITFTASATPSLTIHYTGGSVRLRDGRSVQVRSGSLTFERPELQSHVYKGYAPQNYDGRPQWQRWQDAAANLVPPIDTPTLGGLYHMVLPDSVVVKSGDGKRTYVEGRDYHLNREWGQVMNASSRMGVWKSGSIQISYQLNVQRLDLIQLLPDGRVSIKKGRNAPVCPVLPEPDPGAVALAGIHVNTIDGARRSGFSVQQRDIYPIAPLPPVKPVNPGTIPKTIAKLKAGKNVNIAFFGDSITAGAEASGWFHDRAKTYTSLLVNGIKSRYPGATITQTMAHQSGVSATAGGPTWKKYVMDPHRAGKRVDLVIIAMGMNDKGKPSLDPYKNALRGYIAEAKAAGIEVLMVTPIQSNPFYDKVNTYWVPRSQIAGAMRQVAAETHVALADAYTEWVNQGSRGIAPASQLHNWFNHPGNAGMKVIAGAILGHFPGA